MTGQRVTTTPDEIPIEIVKRMKPGDYAWCEIMKAWLCITPNGIHGNLRLHAITENPDGTITVSPSILCKGHDGKIGPGLNVEYHGYLRAGVWSEC